MKALLLVLLPLVICQVPSNLSATPPMGWMSWEVFRCQVDCESHPDSCINQDLYMQMADAMAEGGYLDAGYHTVSIDDCWESMERVDGKLVPNATRFPDGLKALADYIHNKGIEFGIYTDEGTHTCGGYPGSEGYEAVDAETFAGWGVDYLKVDGCYNNQQGYETGYPAFGKALEGSGRDIVYSCSWPAYLGSDENTKPFDKFIDAGCNLWRNWDDIQDSYSSMASIVEHWGKYDLVLQKYGGVHHWNDMDMLLIGNGGLNVAEAQTQMAIWSIMASPLIMGNDLRSVAKEFQEILVNKEVIAVNQDPLGIPGLRLVDGDEQVWARNLTGGAYAVGLYAKSGGHANCTYTVQKGSYIEASGGGSGNIVCSTGALDAVKESCCDDSDCVSFSFQNNAGSSDAFYCEKNNANGGKVTNSEYDGYNVASRSGGGSSATITVDLTTLGFEASDKLAVRDLFSKKDLGTFQGTYTATVVEHGTHLIKVSKISEEF